MSPSLTEYHLRRARMERLAAERATCTRSRTVHLELASLHSARAEAARFMPANDAFVPELMPA